MRNVAIALLSVVVSAGPCSAQQARSAASNRRPALRGTFIDESFGQGVFSGTFRIDRFGRDRNAVNAMGRLLGVLAASNGDILGRIDRGLTLPVSVISATCELLQLELGPVDIPLRNVQLHLEKGVLGISNRDATTDGLNQRLCAAANVFDLYRKNRPRSWLQSMRCSIRLTIDDQTRAVPARRDDRESPSSAGPDGMPFLEVSQGVRKVTRILRVKQMTGTGQNKRLNVGQPRKRVWRRS